MRRPRRAPRPTGARVSRRQRSSRREGPVRRHPLRRRRQRRAHGRRRRRFIQGDGGDDTITGGKGGDQLHGKDGNDKVNATDNGPDIVLCTRGIDRVAIDRVDSYKSCEKRKVRGKRFSTISVEIGGNDLDAVQLENGSMESFFTVKCRIPTARCDASAQIVTGGRVIAASKVTSRDPGLTGLDFTYARSAIGSDAREIPVDVRLTVKQKGKTERRSIPLILLVEQPTG